MRDGSCAHAKRRPSRSCPSRFYGRKFQKEIFYLTASYFNNPYSFPQNPRLVSLFSNFSPDKSGSFPSCFDNRSLGRFPLLPNGKRGVIKEKPRNDDSSQFCCFVRLCL